MRTAADRIAMIEGSPQDTLVCGLLRTRCGIDPNRLGEVLDLAAVGLVNAVWRNSPVEGWHGADPRLSDGAMLRINAHTTWRVRDLLRRWRSEVGLEPQWVTVALDELDPQYIDMLALRIFRWMVNPGRRLPIGATLVEIAHDGLAEFDEHADTELGSFAASAKDGAASAMRRAAAHGGLACSNWWGTRGWPDLVARFIDVIDDVDHEHWRIPGAEGVLACRPAQVKDQAGFRRVLLRRPWELETDVADWVVDAGIGYLRT